MNSTNSPYYIESKKAPAFVQVPTSKSVAARLLILAAISKRAITIYDVPSCQDIQDLLACFKQIGLRLEEKESSVTIHNSFPACETLTNQTIVLKSGEGGTTNRFLIAMLARGSNSYQLHYYGRMKQRPINELLLALGQLNASATHREHEGYYCIQGPIHPRSIIIDAQRSSQFASALLLSNADCEISIEIKNATSSIPYWEMTSKLVNQFRKNALMDRVPTDWSGASYPLALGLFQGPISINAERSDFLQADKVFLSIIERMGGRLTWQGHRATIWPTTDLLPIEQDCANCLDLVPTLAFICSYIKGTSVLKNLNNLAYKESDRLSEIIRLLDTFGVSYSVRDFDLTIFGPSRKAKFVEYIPAKDHRIAMAAYLFMRYNNGGMLHNIDSIGKSYPNFIDQMEHVDS